MGVDELKTSWDEEVDLGVRFEFGANWASFLGRLTPERIEAAEQALKTMLDAQRLDGRTFLDIGSGSGLSSLVARRLGAKVTSFDYDPQSVACTAELKRRYCSDDPHWKVMRGSVLDEGLLASLGKFDVVYAWGVLHHTGELWKALDNAAGLVSPAGLLFVAIYNDQGRASRIWTAIKRLYVKAPRAVKWTVLIPSFARLWGPTVVRDMFKGRPFRSWKSYGERGMDPWRDVVDWVGGYPFEVATPEQVFNFCRERGFELRKMTTCGGGHGCNQFVFAKADGV